MTPDPDRSMTPAPMPKVQYTSEEKRELLSLLAETWLSAPDLRLGQLLCCAVGFDQLLFYTSDLELHKRLVEFRERVRR